MRKLPTNPLTTGPAPKASPLVKKLAPQGGNTHLTKPKAGPVVRKLAPKAGTSALGVGRAASPLAKRVASSRNPK